MFGSHGPPSLQQSSTFRVKTKVRQCFAFNTAWRVQLWFSLILSHLNANKTCKVRIHSLSSYATHANHQAIHLFPRAVHSSVGAYLTTLCTSQQRGNFWWWRSCFSFSFFLSVEDLTEFICRWERRLILGVPAEDNANLQRRLTKSHAWLFTCQCIQRLQVCVCVCACVYWRRVCASGKGWGRVRKRWRERERGRARCCTCTPEWTN